MNFVELLEKTSNKLTYTENGAKAVNTTDDANLDLFATIGALRTADEERIKILFEKAYEEDPLSAVKILFYARDVNVNIKMIKKWKIKMYIFQYLFLSLCFHKGSFFF